MGWAKFDDRYSEHPKVVAAGPLAELLDRRGIEYCARQETDGFIPEQQARRMCGDLVMDLGVDWMELPKRLIDVARWREVPGGYEVHDFLEYHPPKAKKDAEREAAKERMAKARSRSAELRANNLEKFAEGSVNPGPVPVPQGQDQTLCDAEASHEEPPKPEDDPLYGFEPFWERWPKRNGKRLNRNKAERQWKRLTLTEKRQCYIGAGHYAEASAFGGQGAMDAFRWLQDRLWVEWQEPALPDVRGSPNGRVLALIDGIESPIQ